MCVARGAFGCRERGVKKSGHTCPLSARTREPYLRGLGPPPARVRARHEPRAAARRDRRNHDDAPLQHPRAAQREPHVDRRYASVVSFRFGCVALRCARGVVCARCVSSRLGSVRFVALRCVAVRCVALRPPRVWIEGSVACSLTVPRPLTAVGENSSWACRRSSYGRRRSPLPRGRAAERARDDRPSSRPTWYQGRESPSGEGAHLARTLRAPCEESAHRAAPSVPSASAPPSVRATHCEGPAAAIRHSAPPPSRTHTRLTHPPPNARASRAARALDARHQFRRAAGASRARSVVRILSRPDDGRAVSRTIGLHAFVHAACVVGVCVRAARARDPRRRTGVRRTSSGRCASRARSSRR